MKERKVRRNRKSVLVFLSLALVCAMAIFATAGMNRSPIAIAESTEPSGDTSPCSVCR